MTVILHDDDLDLVPTMAIALSALEEAFKAKSRGEFISPPRHHVSFPGHGDLVFTVGGTLGSMPLAGFRVYDTFIQSTPLRWPSGVIALANHNPCTSVRLPGSMSCGRFGGHEVRLA